MALAGQRRVLNHTNSNSPLSSWPYLRPKTRLTARLNRHPDGPGRKGVIRFPGRYVMKVSEYWEKHSDEAQFDAIELVVEIQLTWHEQRRLLRHWDQRYETVQLPFCGMRHTQSDALARITLSYWTELEPDHLAMSEERNDLNSMCSDDLIALREIITTPLKTQEQPL